MVDCPVCEIAMLPMGRMPFHLNSDHEGNGTLHFCYKCKVLYKGAAGAFHIVHAVLKWTGGFVRSAEPRLDVIVDIEEFNNKNPFIPGGIQNGPKTILIRKALPNCQHTDHERCESILEGNELIIFSPMSNRLRLEPEDKVEVLFKGPWDFGVTPLH